MAEVTASLCPSPQNSRQDCPAWCRQILITGLVLPLTSCTLVRFQHQSLAVSTEQFNELSAEAASSQVHEARGSPFWSPFSDRKAGLWPPLATNAAL